MTHIILTKKLQKGVVFLSNKYLGSVVYFKNKNEVDFFLRYLQLNTAILWECGEKPLEFDLRNAIKESSRDSPFAILTTNKPSNETCLQYGNKRLYEKNNVPPGTIREIMSFQKFTMKHQKYQKF